MSKPQQIVFVAGSHGAGKSRFCSKLALKLDADHVTASNLIRNRKDIGLSKAVAGIDENQAILVEELKKYKSKEGKVILDGHFCLLNENFRVSRLPVELFSSISISNIVLLICEPTVILERLENRDKAASSLSEDHVRKLQKEEIDHAEDVATRLDIPLIEIDVSSDLSSSTLDGIASKLLTENY